MNFSILSQLINTNSFSLNSNGIQQCVEIISDYISDIPNIKQHRFYSKENADLLLVQNICSVPNPLRVLLSGHLDTVHPPLINEEKFRLVGDRIYGDGSCDMKGGIVAMMQILEQCYALPIQLSLVFNIDEETDESIYERELDTLYKNNDVMLVFESGNTPQKSFNLNQRTLVTKRKGIGALTIECFGKGGHSGVLGKKHERQNTLLELAHKIIALENQAQYERGITFNPSVIQGGHVTNVIPAYASMKSDIRYLFKEDKDVIISNLERLAEETQIIGTKTIVTAQIHCEPLEETPMTDYYYSKYDKAAALQNITLSKEIRGGRSDANAGQHSNPKLVIFDGLGPYGEDDHTKNEWSSMNSLNQSIQLTRNFLEELAME